MHLTANIARAIPSPYTINVGISNKIIYIDSMTQPPANYLYKLQFLHVVATCSSFTSSSLLDIIVQSCLYK